MDHKYIQEMQGYCKNLYNNGAEAIILGCTELPLILKESFDTFQFFASSEILAEEVLKR
ncbi:hypothetical protein MK079_03435 [Candidatus Gracilibacteria bacterium]|nr:hypothetical protein [Candidatus Gracilibacteria bacterium]